MGLIRQAMAVRVKYRAVHHDGTWKKRMPLCMLGMQKLNRGGVCPSAGTVYDLGVTLGAGFSEDEANSDEDLHGRTVLR